MRERQEPRWGIVGRQDDGERLAEGGPLDPFSTNSTRPPRCVSPVLSDPRVTLSEPDT